MSNARHRGTNGHNYLLVLLTLITSSAVMVVLGALGMLTSEIIDAFINVLRVVSTM